MQLDCTPCGEIASTLHHACDKFLPGSLVFLRACNIENWEEPGYEAITTCGSKVGGGRVGALEGRQGRFWGFPSPVLGISPSLIINFFQMTEAEKVLLGMFCFVAKCTISGGDSTIY